MNADSRSLIECDIIDSRQAMSWQSSCRTVRALCLSRWNVPVTLEEKTAGDCEIAQRVDRRSRYFSTFPCAGILGARLEPVFPFSHPAHKLTGIFLLSLVLKEFPFGRVEFEEE